MEDLELQEEFTLEDIIREFSDHPEDFPKPLEEQAEESAEEEPAEEAAEEVTEAEAVQEETPEEEPIPEENGEDEEIPTQCESDSEQEEPAEETQEQEEELAEEAAAEEEPAPQVSSDTIRLDTSELLKGVVHNAQPITDEEEEVTAPEEEKPAFTEDWEPEYEQPMGEYVPPQPIAFPSRGDHREMKRKLVIGPEKRYYELTEKGLGKLQMAMLLTFLVVVLSAVSTVMYAQGTIPESRLRLMIFAQFMAVLVSALLGSFQLIQGVADLFNGRFTLTTLLVAPFLAVLPSPWKFCFLFGAPIIAVTENWGRWMCCAKQTG